MLKLSTTNNRSNTPPRSPETDRQTNLDSKIDNLMQAALTALEELPKENSIMRNQFYSDVLDLYDILKTGFTDILTPESYEETPQPAAPPEAQQQVKGTGPKEREARMKNCARALFSALKTLPLLTQQNRLEHILRSISGESPPDPATHTQEASKIPIMKKQPPPYEKQNQQKDRQEAIRRLKIEESQFRELDFSIDNINQINRLSEKNLLTLNEVHPALIKELLKALQKKNLPKTTLRKSSKRANN